MIRARVCPSGRGGLIHVGAGCAEAIPVGSPMRAREALPRPAGKRVTPAGTWPAGPASALTTEAMEDGGWPYVGRL